MICLRRGGWRAISGTGQLPAQASSDEGEAAAKVSDCDVGNVGWRGNAGELHLNAMFGNSVLNGPGTSPVELLSADPAAQFTAPNWISNRFTQVSLSGNLAVSDTASIQAVTYYNSLVQKVSNGNAANDTPCNDGSGLLCADSGPSTTLGGAPILAFAGPSPFSYSELDNQSPSAGLLSRLRVTPQYGPWLDETKDGYPAG